MIEWFAGEGWSEQAAGWGEPAKPGVEDAGRTFWLRRAAVTVLMAITFGWAILAVGALVGLLGLAVATARGGRWLVTEKTEEPLVLREARQIAEQALGRV
ncbi:MAG: hypothetical protein ACRDIY_05390 [Chloroflexota bacterium]